MKRVFFVTIVVSLLLFSCDDYQQVILNANYMSSLNKSISDGQGSGATWTKSPEGIARHFFPPVSHDEGSKSYEVSKKVKSAAVYIVTVTEEGAIDDEVLGERHTIYLQTDGRNWTINDIKYEIKRRK